MYKLYSIIVSNVTKLKYYNKSLDQIINKFLKLEVKDRTKDYLSLLEDELSNRHALGYMVVDILLKLGLTGTVIGFIFLRRM